MGCCPFASSAVKPADVSEGEDAKTAIVAPEHLVSKAKDLLEKPELHLSSASSVLIELTSEIASRQRCPTKGCQKKLLTNTDQHFAAFCHLGDPDYDLPESTDAKAVARGAEIRWKEPFRSLSSRLLKRIVDRLRATPSAVDVMDDAGDLPASPAQETMDGTTADAPLLTAPLDGSQEEQPFDLSRFVNGINDTTMSSQELRRKILAIELFDMAMMSGLTRSDGPDNEADSLLRTASIKAGMQHVDWAKQRGADVFDGGGIIYGIVTAAYLGCDSFSSLSEAYREVKKLPEYWDMAAHASVCLFASAAGRASWYALELLVVEDNIEVGALEACLVPLKAEGLREIDMAIENMLVYRIAAGLPDTITTSVEANALLFADASLENTPTDMLRRSLLPVAWWDIAKSMALFEALGSSEQKIKALLSGHLKAAAGSESVSVMQRALYAAFSIEGLTEELEGASEATSSYLKLQGLDASWNVRFELSHCGVGWAQPVWAELRLIMQGDGFSHTAQETTDPVLPNADVIRLFANAESFGCIDFVSACLQRGLRQATRKLNSSVEKFSLALDPTHADVDVQTILFSTPATAWWEVATRFRDVLGTEWDACQKIAKEAVQAVLSYSIEQAEAVLRLQCSGLDSSSDFALASLRYGLFFAARASDASTPPLWFEAAKLYRKSRKLPSWWDVMSEVQDYGVGSMQGLAEAVIACHSCESADTFATKLVVDSDNPGHDLGRVLKMLLVRIDELPQDSESFEAEARLFSEVIKSDGDETRLQKTLEVMMVYRLLTAIQVSLSKTSEVMIAQMSDSLETKFSSCVKRFLRLAENVATDEAIHCALFIASLQCDIMPACVPPNKESDAKFSGVCSGEFQRLSGSYCNSRNLPQDWNIMGGLSVNPAARAAWSTAQEFADFLGNSGMSLSSARTRLEKLYSDGFPEAAAEAVGAQMRYADTLDGFMYMYEKENDRMLSISPWELRSTLKCLDWWDLARELFKDDARELFQPKSSRYIEKEDSKEEAEMEDQFTQLTKRIFRICDADNDGILSESEHFVFAKLAGFRGSRTAWARQHSAMLVQVFAKHEEFGYSHFARVVSASERFTFEFLDDILSRLEKTRRAPSSPGPKGALVAREDGGQEEIERNMDPITHSLRKAARITAIKHLSWASTAVEQDAPQQRIKLLTRRSLSVVVALGFEDEPGVRNEVQAIVKIFRQLHDLPAWFDVLAAVSAGSTETSGRAWAVVEDLKISWDNSSFLGTLWERLTASGCDASAARTAYFTVFASLLRYLPAEPDQEAKLFTSYLTQGRPEVRSTIGAVVLLDQLLQHPRLESLMQDPTVTRVLDGVFRFAAKRHISWASRVLDESIGTGSTSTIDAARYALFAAHCLCSWAQECYPIQFGTLARNYCTLQGFNARTSSVSSLLVAYDKGVLAEFSALMEEDVPDLADRAEELLTSLVMLGNKRLDIKPGQKIMMPRFEQIEAACVDAGLTESKPTPVVEKMRSQWRRVAGQLVEFSEDRPYLHGGRNVISVRPPESNIIGGVLDVGGAVLCERILDSAIREPIWNALSTAMLKEPPGNEQSVFGNLLRDDADGEELLGAVHVLRMWNAIQRLGLDNSPGVEEVKKQAVQRYLIRSAWCFDGKPDETALLLSLFIGVCLGVDTSLAFEAAAEAYRQLKGVPESWDVRGMVTSYSGKGVARQVWQRAEVIASGCKDPRQVWCGDSREIQALLDEMPWGQMNEEPWKTLLQLVPSKYKPPVYWSHSGVAGKFDEMVAVPRYDPLGNPSAIYATVQQLLDSTWRFVATRDRPCPKGTCKPEAGGCPCVRKDGDPGMPKGIRVRRILRVEDSARWELYLKRKEAMTSKRNGAVEPLLQTKTMPSLGDTRSFEELDAGINEVYLLHGTFVRAALSISQTGFSIDLSGANVGTMYGKGAYFTECSSKADEYARDEPGGYYKGVFALLICRVLMGRPYITEERDEQAMQHYTSGVCDSTMGDRETKVGTYREFVVYEKDQVYPEYCVLYERVGKGYDDLGAEGEWGALRREISKVVMEVPAYWQNVHVNPNAQGFSDVVLAPRRFLQSLLMFEHSSPVNWFVVRAHRIEDSITWTRYLQIKKQHQVRGDTPLSTQFEENLAIERALLKHVIVDTRRPRCKYGAKCFRKNNKHRSETCHPGDPEWDAPEDGIQQGNRQHGEAEMAANLLESIDRSSNEVLLWRSTRQSPEEILEGHGLFKPKPTRKSDGHDSGSDKASRIFYETALGCLNAAASMPSEGDGSLSLVLCRVLCGDCCVYRHRFDGPMDLLSLLLSEKKDSIVGKDGNERVFAVHSGDCVYPEYILQVCKTES